jgi:hypothetical protein
MRCVSVAVLLGAFALGCSRTKATTTTTAAPDAGDIAQTMASALVGDLKLNAASGHVESTGSTGTWTFENGSCFSGDNDGYFGVFIKSKSDPHVWIKLVKDPIKQWTLGVSVPDTCKSGANGQQCDVEYFDGCKKMDVGFATYTFKGRRTGGGHQFDGTATFDCEHSGAHVSGTVTVEKCAP